MTEIKQFLDHREYDSLDRRLRLAQAIDRSRPSVDNDSIQATPDINSSTPQIGIPVESQQVISNVTPQPGTARTEIRVNPENPVA